jgi:Zn-dependent peptidase ImmA (M78 family)
MEASLQEMQSDGASLRAVAKKYGVPRSSLQFKMKNPGHKNMCGPSPVLSHEEESTVVR